MSLLLRETRVSYDSCHFASVLQDGSLSIWNATSRELLKTVKLEPSQGASRHVVDPVNKLVYSGAWENGLVCYDYAAGRLEWRRDDLVGVQRVDLSAGFPGSVFVTVEAPDHLLDEPGIFSGIVELDVRDGSTIWGVEEEGWGYLHPREPMLVIKNRCDRIVRILDESKTEVGSAPMVHFAILDLGFGGGKIALAEGEKGVRILDLNGRVLARYAPKGRRLNCLRVALDGTRVCVFDSWEDSYIIILDALKGSLILEYKVSSHEICFVNGGTHFIDLEGRIFQTCDGQLTATLSGSGKR